MSDSQREGRAPRFNHVAMSVPAERLSAAGRAELIRFYEEVFGWTEMPTLSIDGERLVLRAYDHEQFVFLVADSNPMKCGHMDHFGMSVGTPAELDGMLERAEKFKARDDRVEIIPRQTDDHGVVKLHNFYVRYLLPMMVEIQCYEWAEGIDTSAPPPSR